MRKISTILFFVIFSTVTYGQERRKTELYNLSIQDSLKLETTWNEFINAIGNKDTEKIKEYSLEEIYCDICVIHKSPNLFTDYILPIDTFINMAFTELIGSQLWKAIHERPLNFLGTTIPDFWTKNLPESFKPNLTLYEIWIETYRQNEWAEGHEGQNHGFQFVLINDKFKFYGITSVP